MCLLFVNPRFKVAVLVGLVLSCSGLATIASAQQADYSLVNVRDTVHINSCGSCHLPYSPGLLPMKSWIGIMGGLDNHFGEEVSMSEDNSKHILAYFEKYALAEGQQSVMGKLAVDLPDNPPLRITELPAFIAMHSEAEELMPLDQRSIDTLSSCEGCHRAAASHIFDKFLLQVGHGDGLLSDYK